MKRKTSSISKYDLKIRTASISKPEMQYIDNVLLNPENACHYVLFATKWLDRQLQ